MVSASMSSMIDRITFPSWAVEQGIRLLSGSTEWLLHKDQGVRAPFPWGQGHASHSSVELSGGVESYAAEILDLKNEQELSSSSISLQFYVLLAESIFLSGFFYLWTTAKFSKLLKKVCTPPSEKKKICISYP